MQLHCVYLCLLDYYTIGLEREHYTRKIDVRLINFSRSYLYYFPLCLFDFSINLLVVYRESVNLIGYITRRLSADSLQL